MSFRLLSHRLFQHGRQFVYNYCARRNIYSTILEHQDKRQFARKIGIATKDGLLTSNQTAFKNNTLFRFGQHARRLFVDNILNRVTPIYSADLRNEATKKFLFGDSAPLFALIGICLASGTGILTKDDELEGVCWEIREAISRAHDESNFGKKKNKNEHELGLDNLIIGAPIAKGCSAVVYAATFKNNNNNNNNNDSNIESDRSSMCDYESDASASSISTDQSTPEPNRYVHNFGMSLDNSHFLSIRPTENRTTASKPKRVQRKVQFDSHVSHRSDSNYMQSDASSIPGRNEQFRMNSPDKDIESYPLALKMMFNYDIQSNAMAILKAMYKETIPAINRYCNDAASGWEKSLMEQTVQLPPHPNIVLMFGIFCAQVPNLMQSSTLYPSALPQRLNPNGYGRNMSLFLLMKRYDLSLCEYLQNCDIPMRTRLLLFTQLLEGVAHLYRHGVAHRDLKSDNILIDLNGNDLHPVLVLSDFGCCMADKNNGLTIPYTSFDIDKGGNVALMAPEIIAKTPGTFSILDYSKSDLWSCGAIAYEIFGSENPFYPKSSNPDEQSTIAPIAKSISYDESDLPKLDESVPVLVQKLIANILQRNPNKRLAPDIAANVMQLFLWAPSAWLKPSTNVQCPEILQWLLSLTTKVLYEARLGGPRDEKRDPNDRFGLKSIQLNRIQTEYLLLSSFLIRSQLQHIRQALDWIHHTIEMN